MRTLKIVSVLALCSLSVPALAAKGDFKTGYQQARTKTKPLVTAQPRNWGEVRSQTSQRIGRAAGMTVNAATFGGKVSKRAVLTAGGVAAIAAFGAVDIAAVAGDASIMNKGMEFAGDVADAIVETGKTLASVAPQVGTVAGVAAAGLVAAPTVKYLGGGMVRVWMKNGIAVDMGLGALHAAAAMAVTKDPQYAMAVGFGAQSVSLLGRALTPGAEFYPAHLPR